MRQIHFAYHQGRKWICLFLFLELSCAAAFAQPQAPVEWGEVRWFGIGNGQHRAGVLLMGDTLICVSDSFGQGYTLMSCYSHDNGQTFSPWQLFLDQFWFRAYVFVCGSAGRAYAFCRAFPTSITSFPTGWTFRTLDGGMTWSYSQVQDPNRSAYFATASGLQVIQRQARRISDASYLYEVAISNDGGDIWEPPVQYSEQFHTVWSFAITQGHIILLGLETRTGQLVIHAFTSDRAGQIWSPFLPLTEYPWAAAATALSIAGDSSSETAIVLTVLDTGEEPQRDLYVIRTTDGGGTWETPRALTTGGPIYVQDAFPEIFCRGKLWGAVWENYWSEDSTEWGAYLSLSANHGRDWYPPSPIGIDVPGMEYSGGQFVGNEVRVYWYESIFRHDYATATGILAPDTLPPVVEPLNVPPDTIPTETPLLFSASISDNDTLSRTELRIMDGDSIIAVPLVWDGSGYAAEWTASHAGRYCYRMEGEDFWENVSSYPDTGWAVMVTEGWIDAANDVILHPSSFSLSIFPNPTNGWPRIELAEEWLRNGTVRVTIFDILGRRIWEENARDARVSIGPDQMITTGIYFVRAEAGDRAVMKKFLVLR